MSSSSYQYTSIAFPHWALALVAVRVAIADDVCASEDEVRDLFLHSCGAWDINPALLHELAAPGRRAKLRTDGSVVWVIGAVEYGQFDVESALAAHAIDHDTCVVDTDNGCAEDYTFVRFDQLRHRSEARTCSEDWPEPTTSGTPAPALPQPGMPASIASLSPAAGRLALTILLAQVHGGTVTPACLAQLADAHPAARPFEKLDDPERAALLASLVHGWHACGGDNGAAGTALTACQALGLVPRTRDLEMVAPIEGPGAQWLRQAIHASLAHQSLQRTIIAAADAGRAAP